MLEWIAESAINLLNLTTERYHTTPCWYCSRDRWNGRRVTYKTAEERKRILKGRCYIYA